MEILYYVISEANGWLEPTAEQITLGQRYDGFAAIASGSDIAITVNGEQSLAPAINLTAGTNYKISSVWYDGTTYSNVVSGDFYTLDIIIISAAIIQEDNNLISNINIGNIISSTTIQEDNTLSSSSKVKVTLGLSVTQGSDYAIVYSQFVSLGLGLLMAGIKNITIEKGTTYNTIFTWSTKDAQGVKTPVDISTWTARAQIREEHESTTPVISLTSSPAAGITLGGAAGTIELKITPTVTSAVAIESGVWDLELEDSFGNVVRLLEGKVTFKPEVTR